MKSHLGDHWARNPYIMSKPYICNVPLISISFQIFLSFEFWFEMCSVLCGLCAIPKLCINMNSIITTLQTNYILLERIRHPTVANHKHCYSMYPLCISSHIHIITTWYFALLRFLHLANMYKHNHKQSSTLQIHLWKPIAGQGAGNIIESTSDLIHYIHVKCIGVKYLVS